MADLTPRAQFDLFPNPNLVTAAIVVAAVNAELVLLHTPFTAALVPGVGCERAIGGKHVSPVRPSVISTQQASHGFADRSASGISP
jgi:hypothetical protein